MKQLDIFGRAHPVRPTRRKPAYQPSLIPADLEREADAEDMRTALERIKAASEDTSDEQS